MATKMGPTDIIIVKLRAIALKVSPRATETTKIGTPKRILGQHSPVLDVQGAILVIKVQALTTAAVVGAGLAQACRSLAQDGEARW